MSDSFIGIDLGTSGCRACLIDADKQPVSEARIAFPEPDINGSAVEQDANIWWRAVLEVLEELKQNSAAKNLRAIAVDGTSSTTLVTDDQYQPLAPALMYNDSRAIAEAELVKKIAPPTVSAVFGASSSLSKLLWLVNKYPDAQKVLHQADYIAGSLCGNFVSDFNNSLKLGFDPVNESWPEWIGSFDFPLSLLPEVTTPGTVIGNLKPELQQKLGFDHEVKIVSGTTDSIAGFLATGARQPGDAVVSIGSTIAIKVLNDEPVNSYQEGIYSHKINQQWLVGGASNAGTTILRSLFNDNELQEYSAALDFNNPTGLSYYPIPKSGERFPVYNPEQPCMLSPRPENNVVFLQGILESLTTIEKASYQALLDKGVKPIKRLFTIGGAINNKKWMDYRENELGFQTATAISTEACFGTALLAQQGYNQRQSTTEQ